MTESIPLWSDGRDRPAWFDGNSLARGIADYFDAANECERARLITENEAMRSRLQPADDAVLVKSAAA